ncbi:site-specific DNA-methyltransferase [Hyphomicrobium sp. 99]|uniref:site-specific DNA-methyltransferase n=1 Tax=Hyphomicrobium sp. 99 TaxID=1163419 RepID=UPI0005F8656A|nr:site-specific DNA-methyltransferase [Hyphomicrobium sp. 99]
MPTLDWIGKKAVVNHHREVPYRLIHCDKDKSVGNPDAGNLLVQGDNLEALKALLPYYAGKVKCIYIDPPYNTGNEGWVYNDNVNSPEIRAWLGATVGKEAEDLSRHDKWLCMMYPRLRLLKEFLTEDGVIIISIDDFEAHTLRYMLNDIFGQNNFIAQLVWDKTRKNDAKLFSVGHEYALIYARRLSKLRELKTVWREPKPGAAEILLQYRTWRKEGLSNEEIQSRLRAWYASLANDHPSKKLSRHKWVDDRGVWRDRDISWPGGGGPRYEVIHPVTKEPCEIPPGGWRFATKESFDEQVKLGLIFFREDHTKPPMVKSYLAKGDEEEDDDSASVMGSIIHRQAQVAAKAHRALFDGQKLFENPKDHEVIGRLISYVTDDNDIILDSFAGSGTSGHAVLEQNALLQTSRRFVLIELDDHIAKTVTSERLRRVVEGYNADGDPKKPVAGLGSGFRFCTLGEPLFDADGNVSPAVTYPDLAAHVFFCETGSPIPRRADGSSPLIGTFQGRAIYLLHSAEAIGVASANAGNVLTAAALEKLPLPEPDFDGARVVYAEGCTVPDDRLSRLGVTFKQIPYQIEGL